MSVLSSASAVRQVVVSGYYGCGNAGDEAVLAGIRQGFSRLAGERVRLVALSQNPEETTRLHGMRAVDRMQMRTVRQVIGESDLLLSGGGSLLQDTTSLRSLLYYLYVMRIAATRGKPVMFYAQGIGPLHRRLSKTLVKLAADRAAAITVREEASAKLLQEIGVTRTPIEVTADPAFALTPAEEAVATLIAAEKLPADAPMIGVALRPWGSAAESAVVDYARLLTELERATACRIVLLPMQVPGDVAFAEEVVARTETPNAFPILRNAYSPEALLGLVARMQSVVAMRLHTLIFAARVGVPPFALAYDPKVRHLMNGLRMSEAMEDWRGFDPADVARRVAQQVQDRAAISAALRAQMPEREKAALRNAEVALGLLSA